MRGGRHEAHAAGPDLRRDVLRAYDGAGREHDHGLDQVPEFTDVPRPVVVEQDLERFGSESAELPIVLPAELRDEAADEDGYIAAALAERRHVDVEDVEAVVQVAAELPGLDGLPEVAVGGGDHAHADLDLVVPAHPHEAATLEHPQEPRLGGERHLGDLVEEERTAIGKFEHAPPQ